MHTLEMCFIFRALEPIAPLFSQLQNLDCAETVLFKRLVFSWEGLKHHLMCYFPVCVCFLYILTCSES